MEIAEEEVRVVRVEYLKDTLILGEQDMEHQYQDKDKDKFLNRHKLVLAQDRFHLRTAVEEEEEQGKGLDLLYRILMRLYRQILVKRIRRNNNHNSNNIRFRRYHPHQTLLPREPCLAIIRLETELLRNHNISKLVLPLSPNNNKTNRTQIREGLYLLDRI